MNIALIGMPGSGKSTIGKLIEAALTDFNLVDTDKKAVEKENRSINEIFENDGEEYFRNLESSVLKDILKNNNQIIATGGGIILKEENRKILIENSVTVYLKTSPGELFSRVQNNSERPLLNTQNMKTKIEDLYSARKNLYESTAKITVETGNKCPDEIVKEITVKLNGKC